MEEDETRTAKAEETKERGETGPPLLTPLSEDAVVDFVMPWTARQSSWIQPDIAVAAVRSNVWPGAFAFAVGRYANCRALNASSRSQCAGHFKAACICCLTIETIAVTSSSEVISRRRKERLENADDRAQNAASNLARGRSKYISYPPARNIRRAFNNRPILPRTFAVRANVEEEIMLIRCSHVTGELMRVRLR